MSSEAGLELSRRTRKHHLKVRTGCKNCKARRVKCDESHPTCRACDRRKETCVWSDTTSRSLSQRRRNALVVPNADNAYALRHVGSPPASIPSIFSPEFDMSALELLHNFTADTILTLVFEESHTLHGFQVLAPQIALQNPCLMHAIFAISSLHLHATRPTGNHLAASRSHFRKAVLGLKKFSPVLLVPSQNGQGEVEIPSDVAFVANVLLSMYCLASPSWKPEDRDGPPDIFDWFPLVRAYTMMLSNYWYGLRKGFIQQSPFLPYYITQFPGPPFDASHIIGPLHDLLDHRLCPMDMHELLDDVTVEAYKLMIMKLQQSSDFLSMKGIAKLAVYIFPSSVKKPFLQLFMKRSPRALVIVAHWCALLEQFQGHWWYGPERAKHDIQRIVGLLPEEWLPFMKIPLAVIKRRQDEVVDSIFGDVSLTDVEATPPIPLQSVEKDCSLSSMYIGTQPSRIIF